MIFRYYDKRQGYSVTLGSTTRRAADLKVV